MRRPMTEGDRSQGRCSRMDRVFGGRGVPLDSESTQIGGIRIQCFFTPFGQDTRKMRSNLDQCGGKPISASQIRETRDKFRL